MKMSLMAVAALSAMAAMNTRNVLFADDGSGGGNAPGGATEAKASKSIVDPKYRGNKNDDFVTQLIAAHATAFKDKVTKTPVEGSDPPQTVDVVTKVADGVDVDGLFALAKLNNLDVAKFHEQRGSHGFAGRFRMTVANMLRGAARNRHGIYGPGEGEGAEPVWIDAPKDWLANSKVPAPKEPTHNRDGSKIKKAKPPTETGAAAPEGEEGKAAAE